MMRSNLPQYQRAYLCEDEWEKRREGGVIEAETLTHSRMVRLETLEQTTIGQLFLTTHPPIIHFRGERYVPVEAYDPFMREVHALIDVAVRRAMSRGPTVYDRDRNPDMRESVVYFLRDPEDGQIKIGTSVDPASRIRGIRTMRGREVALVATIPGSHEVETGLHKRFAHCRGIGEWFRPEPDLLAFIATIEGTTK